MRRRLPCVEQPSSSFYLAALDNALSPSMLCSVAETVTRDAPLLSPKSDSSNRANANRPLKTLRRLHKDVSFRLLAISRQLEYCENRK